MNREMAYRQYVDLKFKPTDKHLIAEYYVEPAHGVSIQEAAGGVAAESSVGTWTHLTTITDKRQREKMARVFEIKDNGRVKIAYPPELFEHGNMPQIMSSIAGNIFGVEIIKNLRFENVRFPKSIAKSFKGPR
ncbi:MAG: ribulose-bisphosphate carboxylase large subunit, partial [Candidatus Micrarchaeota archaeon]